MGCPRVEEWCPFCDFVMVYCAVHEDADATRKIRDAHIGEHVEEMIESV